MSDNPIPPRKKAVALRYDAQQDRAPKVVAKGSGILAEKIIEVAKENGIHIQEDPELTALLAKLDIDTDIPEQLYKAVAEILAFVYRLDKRRASEVREARRGR